LKTFTGVAVSCLIGCSSQVRCGRYNKSDPPYQHENDNDDQDSANDADATVSVAITISAEATTEATKQENEQDDNENEPKRHDLFSLLLCYFKLDAEANAEQNCSQIEAR
jgi:hypothetical protein